MNARVETSVSLITLCLKLCQTMTSISYCFSSFASVHRRPELPLVDSLLHLFPNFAFNQVHIWPVENQMSAEMNADVSCPRRLTVLMYAW